MNKLFFVVAFVPLVVLGSASAGDLSQIDKDVYEFLMMTRKNSTQWVMMMERNIC